MVDLGVLAGAVESQVWGVSANGAVIVGESSSSGMQEAFRWENGVMTGLGFLEGGSDSRAYGVSADGLATVGVSNLEAFLSMDGVMIGLGVLDGSFDSTAYAASDDGAIVVGASGEFFTPSAFVWDSVNGMRNLQQVLSTTYGLAGQLAGWHLQGARDISPDGRAIVGYGTNPAGMQEAWLAIIPEPSTGLLFALGVGGLAARRHGS
jgi:probable HAF family extracellular repeat protein